MKKIVFISLLCINSVFGFRLGSFELTPEIGAGAQRVDVDGDTRNYWSTYGRVWVGTNNLVITPQVRYTKMDNDYSNFTNWQYGLSLGYTLDLIAFYATPYVGANYSHFSEYYDDTLGYNAGVRVQPAIIPLALGLEYEYQRPHDRFGNSHTIDGVRFSVGISF